MTCIVQRTIWEMVDYRNDIYIPLCYDAAGTDTLLKIIRDAAALRAEGLGPQELYETISARFADGTYTVPAAGGMSYMVAPLQRTIGPPNLEVATLSMPTTCRMRLVLRTRMLARLQICMTRRACSTRSSTGKELTSRATSSTW